MPQGFTLRMRAVEAHRHATVGKGQRRPWALGALASQGQQQRLNLAPRQSAVDGVGKDLLKRLAQLTILAAAWTQSAELAGPKRLPL